MQYDYHIQLYGPGTAKLLMGPHAPEDIVSDSNGARDDGLDTSSNGSASIDSDRNSDVEDYQAEGITQHSSLQMGQDEMSELSEDDYITSDEEILTNVVSSDEQRHYFGFGSSFAEHTEYFSKSLSYALDSIKLDKSLVAQAQLSGHLNNKSQKLAEKHEELIEKIATLRILYNYHVGSNRIGELEKDLVDLHSRIDNLKNGLPKTLLFGRKGTVGVAEKYPIEYNQAKDKVLERVSE